jgi:hypothetical protein
MPLYRVLLLCANGQRLSELEIDCRDDDDAIDKTGRIDHALAMEVWSGERLVARFPKIGDERVWN